MYSGPQIDQFESVFEQSEAKHNPKMGKVMFLQMSVCSQRVPSGLWSQLIFGGGYSPQVCNWGLRKLGL